MLRFLLPRPPPLPEGLDRRVVEGARATLVVSTDAPAEVSIDSEEPFELLPEGFRATPPQLLYRHHSVLDLSKIKEQLGYRDVVSLEQALERTVTWYSDHPLAPGAEEEQNLGDPFDYDYEDGVISAWQTAQSEFSSAISQLPRKEVVWRHPYQKPAVKS